jgi:hypothetical protein
MNGSVKILNIQVGQQNHTGYEKEIGVHLVLETGGLVWKDCECGAAA